MPSRSVFIKTFYYLCVRITVITSLVVYRRRRERTAMIAGTFIGKREKHCMTMDVKRTYYEDLHIARALLRRDGVVTRNYFYRRCYPLFRSIFDNYYTGCVDCREFMDEIYIVIMSPSRKTGRCQLENYKGESTLASWLKSVCLYHCYGMYELKRRLPICERLCDMNGEENGGDGDRDEAKYGSIEIDFSNLNREDAMAILGRMPNRRYSELIRLRYLELLTNEETARALGMTMENYYNKHKLAKAQYIRIHGKEQQL